jgi:hypothetical protein
MATAARLLFLACLIAYAGWCSPLEETELNMLANLAGRLSELTLRPLAFACHFLEKFLGSEA